VERTPYCTLNCSEMHFMGPPPQGMLARAYLEGMQAVTSNVQSRYLWLISESLNTYPYSISIPIIR